MMAKAVGSPFGPVACLLVVLMNAHFALTVLDDLDECTDELYNKLKTMKRAGVESALREAQSEGKKMVGDAFIARILSYTETSCKGKSVEEYVRFLAPWPVHCGRHKKNKGLSEFQTVSIEERRQSCAEEIRPSLEENVEKLEVEDRHILMNFYDRLLKTTDTLSLFIKAGSFGEEVFSKSSKQNMQPFSSCIKVIETLDKKVPYGVFLKLNSGPSFVKLWSKIRIVCSEFLVGLCKGLKKSSWIYFNEHKDTIKKSKICEKIDSYRNWLGN